MTLHLAFILHIYQPPTQQPSILKQIIKESYKPLFNLLLEKNNIQITFNINGSLFELLDFYEEEEIIDSIRTLIERKQIDLVGSSCYHAILPLIPKEEILRQIQLNEELHHKVLGKYLFKPKGFWLPEMAYEYRVIEPLIESNYEWTVLSSIAYPDTNLPDDIIPLVEPNFITYFRNDLLSNLISFNHPSVEEFYEQMKGEKDPESDNYYLILAMDGETYGHHVKGLIEDFLSPLFERIESDPNVELVKINDLPKIYTEKRRVIPIPSSWSTNAQDLIDGIPFPLWSDPNNRIHHLQLTVMNHSLFLINLAERYSNNPLLDKEIKKRFKNARSWLDKGLHSCQLWWASGKPWYSAEMILKGLNQLILAASEALKVILNSCNDDEVKTNARNIFNEIFEAQKEIYLSV